MLIWKFSDVSAVCLYHRGDKMYKESYTWVVELLEQQTLVTTDSCLVSILTWVVPSWHILADVPFESDHHSELQPSGWKHIICMLKQSCPER